MVHSVRYRISLGIKLTRWLLFGKSHANLVVTASLAHVRIIYMPRLLINKLGGVLGVPQGIRILIPWSPTVRSTDTRRFRPSDQTNQPLFPTFATIMHQSSKKRFNCSKLYFHLKTQTSPEIRRSLAGDPPESRRRLAGVSPEMSLETHR
jgi:hypothetical protein